MGRKPGPGCWGPYEYQPGKWRLIQRDGDGKQVAVPVSSKAVGLRDKAIFLARWQKGGLTVASALETYEGFLRDEKHNKEKSYKETLRRLRLFFADVLEEPLMDITPMRAKGLYESLTKRRATKPEAAGENESAQKGGKRVATDRPLSVDTCRNILAEARTFFRYGVERGWIGKNPLEEVKGKGKRRHGKPQLRIDEARKWLAHAMGLAHKEPGAVAALCTVVLGMRASEIVSRQVRDLDDDGRLVWVEATDDFDTKTEAGRRPLEVDADLRPHLLALATGKQPTDLLFGKHWRDWPREWVQAICEQAGVPKVTAHGMRGLRATLGILGGVGALLQKTADTLGHEQSSTTQQSYIAPGTVQQAQGRAALAVLRGGKK